MKEEPLQADGPALLPEVKLEPQLEPTAAVLPL